MALHLLEALQTYDSRSSLQSQIPQISLKIAKQYVQWLKNIPLDIGETTYTAIIQLEQCMSIETNDITKQYQNLKNAFREIANFNEPSFMMRIAPIACFTALIQAFRPSGESQALRKLIFHETNMTHSNQTCVAANIDYINFLASFMKRKSIQDLQKTLKSMQQNFKNKQQTDIEGSAIEQALKDHIKKSSKLLPADADGKNQGFFKIALYYVIYIFRQIVSNCQSDSDLDNSQIYKHAIKLVIQQGGDTDTNACIVGAAVGSIVGFQNLPTEYFVKILTLRLQNTPKRNNISTYNPVNGFVNLIKLVRKFVV